MDDEGTVAALHHYPVKSMMGQELRAATVGERGLAGDRAFALVDAATGKVASSKNPRLWGRLFDFAAAFTAPVGPGPLPPVRITLPDGADVLSTDPAASDALSKALGRAVRLSAAPPERPSLEEYWPDIEGLAHRDAVTDEAMPLRTFFDAAPVHVVSTSTLDRLRQLYPQGRFEARRFRPNVVVATPQQGFPEASWVGRRVHLGEVELRVTKDCGRCVMTTLPQGDLPLDPGILRAAARHNGANVGVYAEVVSGGRVRRGDAVRLE